MQVREFVGPEPQTDLNIRESALCEMQDVLSSYLPRFHSSAYRQLGNAADAEDAVQDGLLAGYKHLDQFKGQAQMSTWLTSIVMNCARMQLRRRPRQPHLSLDEPTGADQEYCLSDRLADSRPTPEDECRDSEYRRHLLQSVAQLSPSLRRAFELRDLDGCSVKEAARALGLAEGTVKAHVSRARVKLTRLMRRAIRLRVHSAVGRHSPRSLASPEQSGHSRTSQGLHHAMSSTVKAKTKSK